jgi:type II secretory pathway component PulM
MNEERKTENFAVLASRGINAMVPYSGGSGSANKRLAKTMEMAAHVNALARDLCEAMTGGAPTEKPSPVKRGGTEKGFFADMDAQASDIEQALENARAAIEHVRRLV